MSKYFYVGIIFLLTSCGGEVTENSVQRASRESMETFEKLVKQTRNKASDEISARIKEINDNLDKLRDVSAENPNKVAENIQQSIDDLAAQKTNLEGKLKAIQIKTDQSIKLAQDNWNTYNDNLNGLLQDMKTYMNAYQPTDSTP